MSTPASLRFCLNFLTTLSIFGLLSFFFFSRTRDWIWTFPKQGKNSTPELPHLTILFLAALRHGLTVLPWLTVSCHPLAPASQGAGITGGALRTALAHTRVNGISLLLPPSLCIFTLGWRLQRLLRRNMSLRVCVNFAYVFHLLLHLWIGILIRYEWNIFSRSDFAFYFCWLPSYFVIL